MNAFLQDIRYAARTLRCSPGLTAVIVISLAIGIGANAAIFSVVNALLLKPLPYPDPERLVVLWLRSPGINIPQDWPSPGQYVDVRNENRSFDEMSISQGRAGALLGLEQPERVEVLLTSSTLFQMLGARPGFGPGGVISMRLGPSMRQFADRDASLAFYRPFGEALAAVPGVTMRGAVSALPFTSSVGWGSINVEGWTSEPGQELQVDQRGVTPQYFQTMRIPLVQGRSFTDADLANTAAQVLRSMKLLQELRGRTGRLPRWVRRQALLIRSAALQAVSIDVCLRSESVPDNPWPGHADTKRPHGHVSDW